MRLTGVFPPLTTPFDAAGRIDEAGLKSNVARYARTALTGVVALGSNGEAPFLDETESVRVVEIIRGELPRTKILIAGAGRESTRATIDAARRAASAGADAVLVRPPSYYKSRMTTDVLVAHYSNVADESPVPVVLYNVPAFTGLDLPAAAVERLAHHPNIVGVKESAGDVDRIAEDVSKVAQDFAVLCGSMPVFYSSLKAGAAGGVVALACALPDECVELFELFASGRQDEAAALQQSLTPLAKLVTSVHGVPGLKAALDLAGFTGGLPRPPLGPASREAVGEIAAAFAAAAPARSRAS
ncbi:MAG TPA: dihydrodipicolinate synthase family protein [Vicinamibacterales bacterium]|jgi:4-hydroxy-2-oxoglutarate aldolase|nr:dihydrodipicolinate synthase family protein [Vicinamibacterales bacterium]